MRFRTIAFLPPAAGITCLLLLSISSFVSAVEGASASGDLDDPDRIRVQHHESECEGLLREIQMLSNSLATSLSAALAESFTDPSGTPVRSCEVGPRCSDSPLLCPAAREADVVREFARLRSALHQRCGFPLALMDDAWSTPVWAHPAVNGKTSTESWPDRIAMGSDGRCAGADPDLGLELGVPDGSGRFVF